MFSPYHQFKNCKKLENEIEKLTSNSNITDTVIKGHKKYHYALIYKLKSTLWYIDKLNETITVVSPEEITLRPESIRFFINLYLDGFFYTSGSALDILARELLIYYGIALPPNVYYRTAKEQIALIKPSETILSDLSDHTWKTELTNYRNASTHELLLSNSISFNLLFEGQDLKQSFKFPLPDDPRCDISAVSYNKNSDVLEYCRKTFKKELRLINQIYNKIINKITTENQLPFP